MIPHACLRVILPLSLLCRFADSPSPPLLRSCFPAAASIVASPRQPRRVARNVDLFCLKLLKLHTSTTIFVDLTPLLPGGANGGAKPFVLALLTQLAQRHPEALFVAICQPACLSELKPLARANFVFRCVDGADAPQRLLGSRRLARLRQRFWRRSSGAIPASAKLLFAPFGAPLLHRSGLPMVSTFYDLQVEAYPAFFPDAVRSERRYHFDQMAAKATSIAAISEFSREVAIGHGVAADRIVAIPIQLAQHRHGSAVADPPFQLEAGRYLLYPANFWRHKNHELLFTAFAMARQQGLDPGIQLVCTGDGVDRLDLLCHLRDGLGLSSSLLLPGFVSNCELEALLQHCLALVFPSLYEGFGMPVIEAMARGIPVACSSSTSLGEVAGDAAILFDPRNPQQISTAMLTIASLSPGQRQELVEKGLRQSQRYQDSARMADQYWELFHAAMNPC